MRKIIFPLLMVIGAAGNLAFNLAENGDMARSAIWAGLCVYFAVRTGENIGKHRRDKWTDGKT